MHDSTQFCEGPCGHYGDPRQYGGIDEASGRTRLNGRHRHIPDRGTGTDFNNSSIT